MDGSLRPAAQRADDGAKPREYLTSMDIADRLEQIEARLKKVEKIARQMRMADLSLMRLQDGDIVIARIPRPLVDDERADVAAGFRRMLESSGHGDDGCQVAVICGTPGAMP